MQLTKIRDLTTPQMKAMRDGFAEGLLNAGIANPDVVALCADLKESIKFHLFAEKFPGRFFECGIAEQNMAGVAAGLALDGKIAFIGSFACFSPARNFDQIRISICMMNANVKIASSHAAFSSGSDGITAQMLEDVALMRCLPNMKVVVPADALQAMKATEAIVQIPGPVYLRNGRSETPLLFEENDPNIFEFGKAQMLREGEHVTIIANGYMVFRSLLAADALAKKGINVRVLNMHTVKPLDEAAVLESASQTHAIVVAEEAQKFGGLVSAVTETLAQNYPVPVEIVAVNDQFGESGEPLDLTISRHLSEKDIQIAVEKVLQRKV
ncbi:MAG: transketolase C-terminal domain-containing protein [bacterium]